MSYKILFNGADVSNDIIGISPIRERKEIEKKAIIPEYEIDFFYVDWLIKDNTQSPICNINIYEIFIQAENIVSGDVIFKGNIKSIQPDAEKIKVIVSISNVNKLDEKLTINYIKTNPFLIVQNICDTYGIEYNLSRLNYMKNKYNGIFADVIPDDNTTIYDVLNSLAEKFAFQLYFSNNELIVDILDPTQKDDISFSVDDNDIISVSISRNDFEKDLFTNYSFICVDEGDIELTDDDGFNYGKNVRNEFGDIPYSSIDGGSNSVVRIRDSLSGHLSLINYIKYYGREYIEIDIELNLSEFNAFRLETIFSWHSEKYNWNKSFEVVEITRDTDREKIKIKARELEILTLLNLTSGWGFNWGGNYGN